MYIKSSVAKPAGMPGKGILAKDKVYIYDIDDIAYMPSRDAAGVVIPESIVMKSGKYAVAIYCTPGTVEISSNSDGDPDAKGFTPSVKFNHPGSEKEIREFKTNWLDKNVIVVVEYCNGKDSDLIGSPCNPAQLAVEYSGTKDANTSTLTFEQISRGDDVAIYKGTNTLQEPVGTIASGTALTYTADGQYQPAAAVTSIATISGGSHGALITIIGAPSGTGATVAATEDILLVGGTSFVAAPGSSLTLRAFDDGSETLKWIEVSRYNAA